MEVETERLLMRQWRQDDFPAYADFYAHEETARYVGGVMARGTAWRHMALHAGHWTLRGYGVWAVEEKASGALVGGVGLWEPEGWPEPEISFRVLSSAQGKGFATEAAARSVEFAFENLGLQTIVSFIHPENEPSKRVAERLGGRYEKTIALLDYGRYCVYRYTNARM